MGTQSAWRMGLSVLVLVAMQSVGRAAVWEGIEETSTGKKVKKEVLQAGLRTVGKTTLKRVIVAKAVFDATYSATRAVVNLPSYYDAGVAIIDGIQNDKAWAIVGCEVECFGLEVKSDVGKDSASANHSLACALHGSSSAATVQVARGGGGAEGSVNVAGHASAPSSWLLSPEAHWVGLGGVGDKLVIDSDVLDIVEKIKETIVDPTPTPHSSWLDGQASVEAGIGQLSALYRPAGFSILTRVSIPRQGTSEYYLYYEAEVTGSLAVLNPNAELAKDCFGVDLVIRADYYNAAGDIIRTLGGDEVSPLKFSDFGYYDDTVSVDGKALNVFGFALRDYDLALKVNLPGDRDPMLPVLVDMEVLAGSQAASTSVPEPGLMGLLVIGTMCTLWPRRRVW